MLVKITYFIFYTLMSPQHADKMIIRLQILLIAKRKLLAIKN